MNELLMIFCMSISGILFSLGGTDINGKGYKAIRRYLLPFILSIIASYNAILWQSFAYSLILCFFLHLGYGDRCSWLKRVIIFIGYGLPSLFFGFSWWVVITPVILTLLFLGSRWKPLASTIFWKAFEYLGGVLIALCFIGGIQNKW